jgi:hypothetical protein
MFMIADLGSIDPGRAFIAIAESRDHEVTGIDLNVQAAASSEENVLS